MKGILGAIWALIEILSTPNAKKNYVATRVPQVIERRWKFSTCEICGGTIFSLNGGKWEHMILTDIETGRPKDHFPLVVDSSKIEEIK